MKAEEADTTTWGIDTQFPVHLVAAKMLANQAVGRMCADRMEIKMLVPQLVVAVLCNNEAEDVVKMLEALLPLFRGAAAI